MADQMAQDSAAAEALTQGAEGILLEISFFRDPASPGKSVAVRDVYRHCAEGEEAVGPYHGMILLRREIWRDGKWQPS